jgi:crotonobetainyl-CoA:carnitine CoA-transferase CaiB-like acyl-CoA transferase
MGAEVIHIEKPGVGDLARSAFAHGPLVKGENLPFQFVNRNKKGITLDLNKPKGREILKQMIPKADVLIENFIPGTMDRWGLDYQELKKINPGLVMVSISGFGQNGPYREHAGFDLVAQAMSGMMSVTGYPDQPPVKAGGAIADHLGGIYGFCGAMTALYWKQKTGEGQHVDISLMDSTVFTLGDRIVRYAMLHDPELVARIGNRYPMMGRALCVATKDGYFTLRAITAEAVVRLSKLLGVEMPKATNESTGSVNAGQQFERIVGEELASFFKDKTNEEALRIMEGQGVACAPVLSLDQVMEDPQFKVREMLVDVVHPVLGPMKMVGVVPKLSETPGVVRSAGPLLGQHNTEVYARLMGYTEKDLDALKKEGVV